MLEATVNRETLNKQENFRKTISRGSFLSSFQNRCANCISFHLEVLFVEEEKPHKITRQMFIFFILIEVYSHD